MVDCLSDKEIEQLLGERKSLPLDYRAKLKHRPKSGHSESELEITGECGNIFRVVMRQNLINKLDFSVILGFRPKESSRLFRLRRYNGKSHEHTNSVEKNRFYGFHIHTATLRYQQLGAREDSFAEKTDRYSDIHGAFDCLVGDCNFELPPGETFNMFSSDKNE